jgi:hypothetical protein
VTPTLKLGPTTGGEVRSEVDGDAIILAEKLLVRLPPKGGVIAFGSICEESDDAYLARQLAWAVQIIGSKPILFVKAGPACPPEAGGMEQSNEIGLTDVLSGSATLEKALSQSAGGQCLRTIPYGTQREQNARLIISEAFRSFLQAAMRQFHWIFVHCPQLLDQSYSASVIARSDLVVASLKSGRGQVHQVNAIRELCSYFSRPFAGVILT